MHKKTSKAIENMFCNALANKDFLVYYQPKVNLKTNKIVGAEALCRWRRGNEILPPCMFVPILEQSNYICDLDFYMLETVCKDISRWLKEGLRVVRVSVNMSRVHLGDDNLQKKIISTLDAYNVPHNYIEIELTETTTDVDFKELKRVVNDLHKAGISTSVDDFGVGYSSLTLIRDLPWNVLKLDKSFLPTDNDENFFAKRTMLKYVIIMATELGLECIVEGVETEKQIELLKEFSCYRAQGFFFDEPLPLHEFEERLKRVKYA